MAAGGAVDFFKYQEQARNKTFVLLAYYVLAVILIIAAVYAAVATVFMGGMVKAGEEVSFWNPDLFIWVTGFTALVVFLGSVYKISQLSSGGASVATMLGGRPIDPGTADRDERKILNVVEEMAIAAGTPVPRVFLLANEEGINAFAAGFGPQDAVIGVTRGCIRELTRDELQGVIAHEFSHILNGDMRINIRLMGVLFGILALAIIGQILLRTRGKKNPLPLLGLALIIIGYVGVFFGNLIKSAVSRQREYLADASAVQFTRNPFGISGALKKIGGFTGGSRLATSNADQASHLFFANGLAGSLADLFATHPPLPERIKRLDPSFDGDFKKASPARARAVDAPPPAPGIAGATSGFVIRADKVVAGVGMPSGAHLDYAAAVFAGIPAILTGGARDPFGASAVIYGLLFSRDGAVSDGQLRYIEQNAGSALHREVTKILPAVATLPAEHRLPLAELAVSSLKGLSEKQYRDFCGITLHLIEADKQVDLFEYALQRMIMRRLEPVFRKVKPSAVQYYDIGVLLPQCAKLLSCLAYWGAADSAAAEKAFVKGAEKLGVGVSLKIAPDQTCGLQALDESLDGLVGACPAIKKRVIEACVTCIGVDGRVTVEEAELLRVVGDALDCPIPPFLPGQKL